MHLSAKKIKKKLVYTEKITLFFLFVILFRLFYLQVIESHTFLQRGERNYIRYKIIESLRGSILDVKGRLLATNKPITDVYWEGTYGRELSENQQLMCSLVESILNRELDRAAIQIAEKRGMQLLIAHDLTIQEISQLVERLPLTGNIFLQTEVKRYYPHDATASHIIGYLGSIDHSYQGKMGLEKLLEDQLHGIPGKHLYAINSHGKRMYSQEVQVAHAGQDIITTLDLDLQKIAEESFPQEESGAFILMNARDGSIKALVSRPDFNPNQFLEPLNHEQWQSIKDKRPFLNRAFNALYPPASLFKFVTIAAGLELGLIQESNQWFCPGHYMFAGRAYHCAHLEGLGHLSTEEAFVQSCNVPFYDIGRRIKIDTLAAYAHKFGLGEKTNILFYENSGLIPTAEWKKKYKKEQWWVGETLSAAIGQSYLLVTPLQVLCMIAGVCEGYLVKPRIIVNEEIEKRSLDISPKTIAFLKKTLKRVTQCGTGRALSGLKDIDMYAKTGTAQTSDLSKRNLGKKYVEHGWLILHFTYKQEEPLTCVILLENVGSSRVSIKVARSFLQKYCKTIDQATCES